MCITVSASQRGTAQVNLVEKLGVHAPIAKYNAQNAAPSSSAGDESVHPAKSTEDARHIRRDTYYDRLRPGPIRDPGNSGLQAMEWPGFTHWDVRLPAIPAPQSAVIVVGQLAAAQAHLSQNAKSVYSEFILRIDSVLKNTTPQTLEVGSSITADRGIGGVEFPSGSVGYYGPVGMGAPDVGKTYLMFLAADPPAQDLRIVTAFEVKDGKVFAVDGQRCCALSMGRHRTLFDEYTGMDEATFLKLAQEQIANPR